MYRWYNSADNMSMSIWGQGSGVRKDRRRETEKTGVRGQGSGVRKDRRQGKTASRKGANVKNRRTETGEGKDKTLTGKFQTMSLDVSLL